MYLSKNFCYLELHRTGSTHISDLLKKYCPDGKLIGFHNRADQKTYNSDIFFLGSIRNPWDWYVSLWGKGCDKIGEPYKRLTTKKFYFNNIGLKTKPFLAPYIFVQQLNKPLEKWRKLYSDSKNLKNFRSWLKLILNERIYDEGSGFGLSSINRFSGHLTFRYLTLYLKKKDGLFKKSISNINELKILDENLNILNYTIKNENLEDNFLEFLNKINIKINSNQRQIIKSSAYEKPKKSSRISNFLEYYDQECTDLVFNREKLIIDKYNYDFKKNNI
jgi:hypothetical protein